MRIRCQQIPCVATPQRSQLFLTTNVPHQKLCAFRLTAGATNFFAIETNRGHRVQVLVELQAIQRCGFARRIQTEHYNVKGSLC